MKVGISTATYFTKLVTEDTFSVISRCGGECAEVFLTTYSELEPAFSDLLIEKKGDLDVYSVHSLSTSFEPQLFNAAPRTVADAEIFFDKVLAAGEKLGAKCYTFHGSTRVKKTAYYDPEKFGARINELAKMALAHGIKLCFENVHWCAFNTPQFFEKMKKFAPDVYTTLDVKQAWQSGSDWNDYISAMGDRLANVHLCDHDADGKICMVGKGVFPFDKLIERLKKEGYGGPVILEQYAKDYQSFSEVEESVQYLKNIIGGIYAD